MVIPAIPQIIKILGLIFFLWLSLFIMLLYFYDSENNTFEVYFEDFTLYSELLFDHLKPECIDSDEVHSHILSRDQREETPSYVPISYGFDSYNEKSFFQFKSYDKCNFNSIFTLINNTYYIAKPNNTELLVIQGCNRDEEQFGGGKLEFPIIFPEDNFTINDNCEYFYARHSNSSGNAMLRNVYKQEYASKAKNISEAIIKSSGTTEFRPLTVVMFVIDSVSRQGLYRNLKKTIQWINDDVVSSDGDYAKDFVVYDYKLINAIEAFTVPNLVPLLYGISKEQALKKLVSANNDKIEDQHKFTMLQQNYSLFSHFKSLGYVTMFLNDVVTDYLSKVTGRKILSDHQASNFWKLGKEYYQYDDFNNNDQCIGEYPPHYYSLKYLSEFLKNYQNYNRFAYVHINTAHAGIGTRLNIADSDFKTFFQDLLQIYKQSKEDILFVFMSDHGTSRGDFIGLNSLAERVNPFQLIISNKRLIKSLDAQKYLEINTQRLVSRYDIYRSLKNIAWVPYRMMNDSIDEGIYTEIKSVNIFNKEIFFNRTCDDAGVKENFCLAVKFEDIDPISLATNDITKFAVLESINMINAVLGKINCQKYSLRIVFRIQKLQMEKDKDLPNTHYLIQFGVNENPNAVFLTHMTHGYQNQYIGINEKKPFQSIKRVFVKKEGKSYYYSVTKIWSVSRLDPTSYSTNLRKCGESIKFSNNFIYSGISKNCLETCKSEGLNCTTHSFSTTLSGYYEKMGFDIEKVGTGSSIELYKTIVEFGSGDSCTMMYNKGTGICQCTLKELL
ncbi:hypothetical protein SteCoe_33360 [Stentor coeruleus]|uniref:Uncharacterized protein n=1 Tax=Stentor coeruleus TaxID=5963 RepID=A0A1R2AWZ0_9CILI|nr:hypothetical protein SteCoe_33360 [Stentor coeruleus]